MPRYYFDVREGVRLVPDDVAGFSDRQIADVLGQKTEAVVSIYTKKGDMRASNARVIRDLFGKGVSRTVFRKMPWRDDD
jgi:hypothetical protein